MASTMERKLAEMLVRDNVITQDVLNEALNQQANEGGSLGRVLIEGGYANEWELAATLGKQLNVPFITLMHYEIDPEILTCIPEDIVKKYKIVPIDKTEDTLTVALADPSNIYLLDELRLLTKLKIVPVISFESDIEEAIHQYYGISSNSDESIKEMSEEDASELELAMSSDFTTIEDEVEEPEDEEELQSGPVVSLVNQTILDAIKTRASDIHIEPYEKDLRIRHRIDGVLHEMKAPPKKFQNAIVSRIKIMSTLDIAERRLPQDGRFKMPFGGKNIDFRVSTCPVAFGEKVVMRILDSSNLMLNLTDLGMEMSVLTRFEKHIRAAWGMILVTGPTGSGKSTTLYSALSTINDPQKNIITIEDPIEYQLKGINQVQVRADIGLDFASGLRSFLRQDPDIIMVGEIRDKETAEIAVKSALTGHLVLSTLHTNDAPSSINRLTNMGVEAFLVTASTNMIVAQRLVRRVCENCRVAFSPPPEVLQALGMPTDGVLQRGQGCDRCRGSGYKGRVALYELMELSDMMRDRIVEGIPATQLKKLAIEEGMQTLRGAGFDKVAQGMTTMDEVLGVTAADER